MRKFRVLVHAAEEDGYWAEVPELPGCFGSGDSLDELEADVKGAIETYIEAYKEIGTPLPEAPEVTLSTDRWWEIAVLA